ncbi:EpsG family protein [Glaesserella parasuis]|nr:EpsG family protein [Glaesserella parasuis]
MIMGFYIFLILVTLLFSTFIDSKKFYRLCYIIVFFLLVCWSILCRTYAIQKDMLVYLDVMKYEIDIFFSSFYFLREPVYWISSKILFDIIQNDILVIIIFDIVVFSVFIISCYYARVKPYFVLLFFLFFPSLMGILNVYRQYLSTIFLFCCLLFYNRKRITFIPNFIFIFAFFTHNVVGVFFPILFLIRKHINIILFALSSVVSILLTVAYQDSKSMSGSGETSPFLFLLLILIVFFVFILLNKFSFKEPSLMFFYMNFYLCVLAVSSVFFLSDVAAKRILMLGLMLLLFSIYVSIEQIKGNKFLLRVIFVIISVAPTFLFSTALDMLLI